MKTVFVIYKTDAHHSFDSRDLIWIATRKEKAIKICKIKAKTEGEKINADDIYNLEHINQTQNYLGFGWYGDNVFCIWYFAIYCRYNK